MFESVFLSGLASALSAALAILGLFIDKSSKSFKLILPFFCSVAAALFLSQIIFERAQKRENDQIVDTAIDQRSSLLKLVDGLSISSLRVSSYLSDVLLSQPKILSDFGLTEERAGKPLNQLSTQDLQKKSILSANQLRAELAQNNPASERIKTKIWYYTKELDNPNLLKAISELGYPVESKIAARNQADDLTNAVWYGPNVDLEDYKLVIVTLIRAGIPIRRLAPSCNAKNQKYGVIEIGASDNAAGLLGRPKANAKTIDDIRDAADYIDLVDKTCQ